MLSSLPRVNRRCASRNILQRKRYTRPLLVEGGLREPFEGNSICVWWEMRKTQGNGHCWPHRGILLFRRHKGFNKVYGRCFFCYRLVIGLLPDKDKCNKSSPNTSARSSMIIECFNVMIILHAMPWMRCPENSSNDSHDATAQTVIQAACDLVAPWPRIDRPRGAIYATRQSANTR